MHDENSLMDGIREGRPECFKLLYDHYYLHLWHFARRFVSEDAADDVVQAVIIDLWNRRASVVIERGLRQYLFTAVRYRAVDIFRKDRKLVGIDDDKSLETMHMTSAGEALGSPMALMDTMNAGDLTEAIRKAINTLDPIPRNVMELRWFHEMSYDDIADIMGISQSAARQHVSRAIRVIRPVLERLLGGVRS